MPPAALSRVEAMSDHMNAIIYNPFFLVDSIDCRAAHSQVPWSLQGATIHNVVIAMCIAPSVHKEMSLMHRCEVSLTGFIALDLFRLLSDRKCAAWGLPKGIFDFLQQISIYIYIFFINIIRFVFILIYSGQVFGYLWVTVCGHFVVCGSANLFYMFVEL